MALKPRNRALRGLSRAGHATGAALLYTISLPERLVRALTASVGGALKETTDLLVPTALKGSTFYRIFIENLLRYGLEYIGQVEGVYPQNEEESGGGTVGKDYPVRKTVGNVLEGASIAAFQFSPLWIFAIGSDVLKGGKAFVEELQQELVLRGLARGDMEPGNAYQLMASLEATTDALAANVDTPPLSRTALKEHGEKLKLALEEVQAALAGSKDKLQEIFDDFRHLADQAGEEGEPAGEGETEGEGRTKPGMLAVAGVMTLSAVQQIPLSVKRAATGAEVAADMVVDQLLLYYPRTLADIHQRGYVKVASEALAPYGRAVVANFRVENPTLTERLFKGTGRKLKDFLTGQGEFDWEATVEWEWEEGEDEDVGGDEGAQDAFEPGGEERTDEGNP